MQTLKNAFLENKDLSISGDGVNGNFRKTTAVKLWDEQMKRIEIELKKLPRGLATWLASLDETFNKGKASLRSNDKNKLKKQKSGREVNASTLSAIDNVLLSDNNLSVGTVIKRKAVELFNDGPAVNSREYKIMTNGLSSILDICDITESSQKSLFNDSDWEFLVKTYTDKYDITLIPVNDLILSTWKIVVNSITNTRDISFKLKYIYQIFPKHLKKHYFFCLKLCEHMLNLIQMHPTMLIKVDPPAFSENDHLRVVWSDFFEYLFPASGNIKIKTVVVTMPNVSMGWSVQNGGSSCFFCAVHLDADGLYLKVPKFQFSLPSTIADFGDYTDFLKFLASKHSGQAAFGKANNDEANLDPRIYWIRDLYYTPPSNTKPGLTTYLFDCAPPSSIMDKLLSLSHEKKQDLNHIYKDCVFDENGWTFSGDHCFNTIINERSTSSSYKASDDEEGFTSSDDNPIPDSDTAASEFDTVMVQDSDTIAQEFDAATGNSDAAIQNSGTNNQNPDTATHGDRMVSSPTSVSRAQTYQGGV
ncbi:uncharacterized protein EV154DRAFT_548701 [Mucor mucedo]|uniref:uncharacterized protein n=1 Tax=Mucor mucedo TaxID=29922 RepID=UPI00221F4054|nr:uncharacterized protein EV154DRAFT_548701 [Mucor mucedo]KAI7894817.1 hypothetical protein EV154DRAFT_548701 [Mucor mucedo]